MIHVTSLLEMPVGKLLFASENNFVEMYIVDEILCDAVKFKKAIVAGPGKQITYTTEIIPKEELFLKYKWYTRKGF